MARFARLAKKGARLVYATCAVGRTENAEVAAFAEREVGLAPLPLAAALPAGLAAALGAPANTVQLLPHRHGTDGFFISAFEKR